MTALMRNNATSTLTTALSTTGTIITIEPADAEKFPSPFGQDWYPITIDDLKGNEEIVKVRIRSQNKLTIERAQEGTSALSFPIGSRIDLRLTAAVIDSFLHLPAGVKTNYIINGDFRVTVRGNNRNTPVGTYGLDRWKGHDWGLEQVVEAMPSGKYTLTWSGGGTGVLNWVVNGKSPLVATVAAGDLDIVVPRNATNVSLVWGDASASDPFYPRSYEDELRRCQRYYVNLGGLDGFTSYYWTLFPLPNLIQHMRLYPRISSGAMIYVSDSTVLEAKPELNLHQNAIAIHSTKADLNYPKPSWVKLKDVIFDGDF